MRFSSQSLEETKRALPEFHKLAQEIVIRNAGLVFKAGSSGLRAAFESPQQALKAAADLQMTTLTSAKLKPVVQSARIAIHTGQAVLSGENYAGPTVTRAEKILAAAHFGQVLLSSSTASFVRNSLPREMDLLELPFQERVFQLLHPDWPVEFPPLLAEKSPSHNFPKQSTSFIGREKEIKKLEALLQTTRLLTLTGSGGCGKTRLAIQVAARTLGSYPDGTWMADFSPLHTASVVTQTIAKILGVQEERNRPLVKSLCDFLQSKKLLLLLDNCEHVLEASSELVRVLLRSCPLLSILATSREPLRISGELAWRVPPLSMPDKTQLQSPEKLLESDAASLFVERAKAVSGTFRLPSENASWVAQICTRLDGIPLAIELAAARLTNLPPAEIYSRLQNRFRLLVGSTSQALPRHQTLRAAIDWSYNLLDKKERTLLGKLSVFSGGFTREAVQKVCAGSKTQEENLPMLLSRVAEKSLVLKEGTTENLRYQMLESIREYAVEKLAKSGDASTIRKKHAEYFLRLAESADALLTGPGQTDALDRLEAEHDNLRTALDWCNQNPDGQELALRLAGALFWFWAVRGHLSEGREYLGRVLSRKSPDAHKTFRAKALYGQFSLAFEQGDYAQAESLAPKCLEISREISDRKLLAATLSRFGEIAILQGKYPEASGYYGESLSIFRELNDHWNTANVLTNLGVLAEKNGEYAKAEDLYRQSLPTYQEEGDLRGTALVLNNLGELKRISGEYDSAYGYYEQAFQIFEMLGDRQKAAGVLIGLGETTLAQGQCERAFSIFKESLKISIEIGERLGMAWSLERLAWASLARNEPERSAMLLGAAESFCKKIGYRLSHSEMEMHKNCSSHALRELGQETFSRAFAEGESMPKDALTAYALNSVH